MTSISLVIALAVLVAILLLVSYTSRLTTESGKFLSREFQENIEFFEQQVEPRFKVSHWRAALSMAILEQLCTAAIAFILAYFVFVSPAWSVSELAESALLLVVIVLIFHRFIPFLLFSRTRGEWLLGAVPVLRILIYLVMPLTLVMGFLQSVAALTKEHSGEEPEHPSEAVDALIEAGQDEGILEESDRELIHSVVEFGDKSVHDVMTARPNVVAVSTATTVEQLTNILREHPYSRVPVYEGDIDHIVGILLTRDLLQVADSEASTRTVHEIMKPDVYLVPETKRASELLGEMQRANVRMAIVIDEYGGLAGLVTVEDLVEEIVGELRDEHDPKSKIVREGEHSYIVPGALDVDLLNELFGVRIDDRDATTVAGLVTETAGHIPRPGEIIESDSLRFEVLASTTRRVDRVRITPAVAKDTDTVHKTDAAG